MYFFCFISVWNTPVSTPSIERHKIIVLLDTIFRHAPPKKIPLLHQWPCVKLIQIPPEADLTRVGFCKLCGVWRKPGSFLSWFLLLKSTPGTYSRSNWLIFSYCPDIIMYMIAKMFYSFSLLLLGVGVGVVIAASLVENSLVCCKFATAVFCFTMLGSNWGRSFHELYKYREHPWCMGSSYLSQSNFYSLKILFSKGYKSIFQPLKIKPQDSLWHSWL